MKTVFSTSISARAFNAIKVLLLAAVLTVPVAASAQNAPPVRASSTGRIAVVDLQFLVANSRAGKSIRSQLDERRNAYRPQIDKQENELRAAEKDLIAQQNTLSKEDFLKKRKEFAERVMAAERSVNLRRQAFDKAYMEALEKLREQIVKIVADIAGKNEIALVLNRQEVVLVEAKMDITKDVLAALDGKVSSIPVNIK
ncbi:MAG: Outer rane family protein [Alphaproteobacteria bacterium]|nr:Outer rane family protein [Alphaproteobacteria bacterium]